MAKLALVAVHTWNFVFTLLSMSLIGNVIADAFSGNPSSINYAMFVSVISMIAALYGLAGGLVESLSHWAVHMGLDVLSAVFSFIAGTVLAAKLHVHSCSNQVSSLRFRFLQQLSDVPRAISAQILSPMALTT